MDTYRELYFHLFRATEAALQALEQQNFGTAQEILIQAQQLSEESVLSDSFHAGE